MNIQGITPKHVLYFFGTLFIGLALIVGIISIGRWPQSIDQPYRMTVTQEKPTP